MSPSKTKSSAMNPIALITDANEKLHSDSTFKGMLGNFGATLKSLCGTQTFGVFQFCKDKSLVRIKLKSHDLNKINEDVCESLKVFILHDIDALSNADQGMITLSLDGSNYHLCSVANPIETESQCFVLWDSVDLDATQESIVNILVSQIQRESTWYQKLENTQSQLYIDELTELYNFRYFEIALDNELRRAGRFDINFCILFIDLDDFKPINDTHGHLSGSSVLCQVAEEIREAIREVDIPIRFGGDEFVVVLLGASASKGQLVAERIRKRIANRNFRMEDGKTDHVTASIGVAAYPEHAKSRDDLLKLADTMMYKCKKTGKNRVTVVESKRLNTDKSIQDKL